jgi:5-methylcytosine-specific restriction endonuclease McrA
MTEFEADNPDDDVRENPRDRKRKIMRIAEYLETLSESELRNFLPDLHNRVNTHLRPLRHAYLDRGEDDARPGFYGTREWKEVRYSVLARFGGKCCCCGADRFSGAILDVDHIKPRSKYPELALDPDNLQVLCRDCNEGKSNRDERDWRRGWLKR